jgi:polar amino acid transport system substrate-binding protein
MRQVAQRPKDGAISIVQAPRPTVSRGWVLVANRFSLISAGTERNKVVTGEKNLIQKARARPDLVRKLVDRARVEGVGAAVSVARDRLTALAAIGYSSAGDVLEVGRGVAALAPGDRVACGGGWASHAEVVSVPANLVARLPDSVGLEDAAYSTVGAVALHAIRQADASLGETVGVIGLGLVGQLAVRLLLASGCSVVGIDPDPNAVKLARTAGADAFERDAVGLEEAILARTRGAGLDALLLCAATHSADPIRLAVTLARDRGRIVVVGETEIDVNRAAMYEKELEIRMARSYGPGRHDPDYEERGRDYPAGYVRWTEGRNIQAFVDLVAAAKVRPSELTTHRFPVERAAEAYELLKGPPENGRPFGVLLEYGESLVISAPDRRGASRRQTEGRAVGLIGAGAFARSTLIPALKEAGASLAAVASERGLTAADVASRYGFERAADSSEEILHDESIAAVVIATRHPSHAGLAAAAMRAGKAVLVEKPLALSTDQLEEVEAALERDSILMVGFNRRFAPLVERIVEEIAGIDDLVLSMRVNAGPLPNDHWLLDPEDGGGRLIGEGCHFVDLLATLAGTSPVLAHAVAVPQPGRALECSDSFSGHIRFQNAVGALIYSGSGDSRLPKERLEVFGGGLAATLDDFRRLTIYRSRKARTWKSGHDKGHRAEIARFIAVVEGREMPPSPASYLDSTRLTLALAESVRAGVPIDLSG